MVAVGVDFEFAGRKCSRAVVVVVVVVGALEIVGHTAGDNMKSTAGAVEKVPSLGDRPGC